MTSFLNYNGIGMSLLNYYNYIDADKIQMDYLVPNKVDENLKKEFTKKGNKLFEFDYKNKKMHQRRPIKYCIKLYKLIKQEKYDIVHAHGSSSMLFLQLLTAKLAGVKVRIAHSRNTNAIFGFLNIVFKPLFKISYTDALACGREAGEWLFGKKAQFTVIPNGKDCNMFEYRDSIREEYRKKYNIENKIVIGHVGNINCQKNHEFLIKVFNELKSHNKDYYLILAGDGPLIGDIKKQVVDLNLEEDILFLGQISVDDVAKWLNAMDIMVFPSKWEGFPNVLIEWQISCLPCVVSDAITKDVKITELVSFKSLKDLPIEWAKEIESISIIDRNSIKYKIMEEVKKAGYDIKENAKFLEELYQKMLLNK